MPMPGDVATAVERKVDEMVVALVRDGRDVVLDRACASRAVRDGYRARLTASGAAVEVVFVATARHIALARVAARQPSGGPEYAISAELAAAYYDGFEVPTGEEGPFRVVSGEHAGR